MGIIISLTESMSAEVRSIDLNDSMHLRTSSSVDGIIVGNMGTVIQVFSVILKEWVVLIGNHYWIYNNLAVFTRRISSYSGEIKNSQSR
jgi:hypothetical protein